MVAYAVAPSVHIPGMFHRAVVVVEVKSAVVYLVHDSVLECGKFRRQQQARFQVSFGIEGRAREFAVYVLVGVVPEAVKMRAPLFVEEVDLARYAVVHHKEKRRDGCRILVLGGGVGDDVEFAGAPALEGGLEEDVAHEPVFEFRFFRIAEYGNDGVTLEIVFFAFLCGNRSQER